MQDLRFSRLEQISRDVGEMVGRNQWCVVLHNKDDGYVYSWALARREANKIWMVWQVDRNDKWETRGGSRIAMRRFLAIVNVVVETQATVVTMKSTG